MRNRLRFAAVLLVGVTLVAAAAGCASTPEPEPVPILVGETLLELRPYVEGSPLIVYDVSLPVLGIQPAYNDGQPQGNWEIVAQCIQRGTVAVAVLPIDSVTPEIEGRAAAKEFDGTIADCS